MPQKHLVRCPGEVDTVVHELGGTGPALLILPANGFPSRAYLPLVSLPQVLDFIVSHRKCGI